MLTKNIEERLEQWQLIQRQDLPLDIKLQLTQHRIKEYYNHFEGDVTVSFSGGIDSLVLLHIAREMYPDMRAVFFNTGLEYPEIVSFVREQKNIEVFRPKYSFKEVIDKYGYPVVSKQIASYIYQVRNTKSERLRQVRLHGDGRNLYSSKIPNKHMYLLDAPFKISELCCYHLKKSPARKVKSHPITGELAEESYRRTLNYLKFGCISFDLEKSYCRPLAFWRRQDILRYIKDHNLAISKIYGEIVENSKGLLETTGVRSTGCVFCLFGLHLEKSPNRFEQLKQIHPKLHEYGRTQLGLDKVCEFMGINYG